MSGNKTGAQKARDTNLAKDPNFYANIAKKSWKNPNRSRKTGFALDPERARRAGQVGGKKTKNEYKTNKVQAWEDRDPSRPYEVGEEFTIQGEVYEVAPTEEITIDEQPEEEHTGSSKQIC